MSTKFLKLVAGKELRREKIKIKDEQLLLGQPKIIELRIFRNDEPETKETERFQVEIIMPWGHIYRVVKCPTRKEVERKYKELVARLRTGQAALVFGREITIRFLS